MWPTVKALIFAYYFPPCAGPGVRRSVRFVSGLRQHGIEPIVVTARENIYELSDEYGVDRAGLDELPSDLRIERTEGGTLFRTRRLLMKSKLMRAAQALAYPLFWERQAPWVPSAIARGVKLIREIKPDVIYTSTGPFCTNLIGWALHEWTGVPWVTDYRDLWTGSWLKWWPTRVHFELERAVERACLRRASAVVANTPEAARQIAREFPSTDRSKIAVITHGWDELDDIEPAGADGRVVFLHTGSLDDRASPPHRESGWKGIVRRFVRDRIEYRRPEYDLSTHGLRHLFGALVRLRNTSPDVASRVRLRLVGGGVHPSWQGEAARLGIADLVEFVGPVPFRESRARQASADALLLTTVSRHDGRPVPRVNAKIYEYMKAERPILALTDPGDVADFVRKSGLGTVVAPRDEAAIAVEIRRVVDRRDHDMGAPEVDRKFVEQFESSVLTARLSETLRRAAK